jgi:hypothetical protein
MQPAGGGLQSLLVEHSFGRGIWQMQTTSTAKSSREPQRAPRIAGRRCVCALLACAFLDACTQGIDEKSGFFWFGACGTPI